MQASTQRWTWKVADDPDSVHALLCASDAANAGSREGAPPRSLETTRRHVAARDVHVLCRDEELVAMFTLSEVPPADLCLGCFPVASRPLYLQRLAVQPDWLAREDLAGLRCVRMALEMAKARGADVVRAEANPELAATRMLHIVGFVQVGRNLVRAGRAVVHLQCTL